MRRNTTDDKSPIDRLEMVFKALADTTRLRILALYVRDAPGGGSCCAPRQ